MGCGIARFGRKGLKTTETWKFWSQILSPGVLRRGAPGVSRHGAMGFRGAAQGFRGTAPRGFEARRHGVSRGGATALIALTALIWRRPSRSRLITRIPLKFRGFCRISTRKKSKYMRETTLAYKLKYALGNRNASRVCRRKKCEDSKWF